MNRYSKEPLSRLSVLLLVNKKFAESIKDNLYITLCKLFGTPTTAGKALQYGGYPTFTEESGWNPEDPPSNMWGAIFGQYEINTNSLTKEDISKFANLMKELGI